jgi:acyl-homoserine lactone acylase PvdQ
MKYFASAGTLLLVCLLGACSNDRDSTFDGGPAAPFDPFGDNGVFLNVLTPGQADCPTGGAPQPCPATFTDQLKMYENLAFTQPDQLKTVADLVPAFYKTSAFVKQDGTPPAETSFVSTATVTDGTRTAVIKRDTFGVPYVYGTTRADVMFGTGYATAEDRTFLMDALRHVGRGRQSDFLGTPVADTLDADLAIKAGYDEAELQAQADQLAARFGADGAQALADVGDYAAGINRYLATIRNTPNQPIEYTALTLPLLDYTPRDVVAIATLVQAIFAVGGGSEHRQVQLLRELEVQAGSATAACQLWRDLRHFDDPEKPTSADDRFATQSPPTVDETLCPLDASFAGSFAGSTLFDRGSLQLRLPLTEAPCRPGSCPDFRGDVVNDPVSAPSSAQSLPAGDAVFPSLDLSGLRKLLRPVEAAPVPPWAGTPAELLSATQRAEGAARARETARAVTLALSREAFPAAMSNALLVAGSQTESGHPIAVFGPQTGYFAPQLLLELNQMGGDIQSRGMTFAGVPYVLIGRGVDHAWSATSSGDDIIDTRVLRLCNVDASPATRDSVAYLHDGVCKPMFERVDEWTAEYNAGAPPPNPPDGSVGRKITRRILRAPDYGPVFATATVNGAPVALATQRSTYFGEVDSAIPFVRTSRNLMSDPQSFYETFNLLTGTFNWFYVDDNNIAYFNSGLLPIRAAGVHPDLPAWGDGNYDWQQTGTGQLNPGFSLSNFLPMDAHPRQTNPAKGYMTSWNNAQAPGFWAAEHQQSYGPVHRSDKLDARLRAFQAAGLKHTPASMVEIMEDAGTTDLRGQEVLPAMFAVLDTAGPALTTAQADAVNKLKAWVADGTRGLGAHRRDRDGPGLDPTALTYKDRESVILVDRWWDTMVEDVLPQIFSLESTPNGNVVNNIRHDAPGPVGSAFIDGYYGYAQRVLDMALNRSAHPYRQLKCAGTGVLADCRAALIESLQKALDLLPDSPADWDGTDNDDPDDPRTLGTVEEEDAIVHSAVGLAEVDSIHWVNRPTWQQVVQPTRGRR